MSRPADTMDASTASRRQMTAAAQHGALKPDPLVKAMAEHSAAVAADAAAAPAQGPDLLEECERISNDVIRCYVSNREPDMWVTARLRAVVTGLLETALNYPDPATLERARTALCDLQNAAKSRR